MATLTQYSLPQTDIANDTANGTNLYPERVAAIEVKRARYPYYEVFGINYGVRAIQKTTKVDRDDRTASNIPGAVGLQSLIITSQLNPGLADVRIPTTSSAIEVAEDIYLSSPSDQTWQQAMDAINALTPGLMTATDALTKSVHEYAKLWAGLDSTILHPRITGALLFDDATFAREALIGAAPNLIERVDQAVYNALLAAGFGNHIFQPASPFTLQNDTDLARILAENRLYVEDFGVLNNMKPKFGNRAAGNNRDEHCYIFAPMVLYAVTAGSNPRLLPLAIQCRQIAYDGPDPIFYPHAPGAVTYQEDLNANNNRNYEWQMAKTTVQNARTLYHEAYCHLGSHFITETFAIAMARHLSISHPVYALLKPHLAYVMGINVTARNGSLLRVDGNVNDVFGATLESFIDTAAKAVRDFKLSEVAIPRAIARRNVGSLPNYLYRDDASAVWNQIAIYVESFLTPYYSNMSNALANDPEMTAFINEITRDIPLSSTGNFGGLKGLNIDLNLNTHPEMIEFLTYIIYNASAGHHALNMAQMDRIGNMAWYPGSINMPTPTAATSSRRHYLEMLPTYANCVEQMGFFIALGMNLGDDAAGRYLTTLEKADYVDDRILNDDNVWPAYGRISLIDGFNNAMNQLTAQIDARNLVLPIEQQYVYLRPANIHKNTHI